MIYDLLATYRQISDSHTMTLDSYILSNGLYIRLYTDEREPDVLLVERQTPQSGELYNWFREVDFYSRLIEMNKPVDPKKKIHSNNMYSVFFKHGSGQDTLVSDGKLSSEFEDRISRYFDALAKPKKEHTKILKSYNFPDIDKEAIQRNKEKILSISDWLVKKVLSYDFKSEVYIKLFFDVAISEYKRESDRYLIPRIFNNNKYNITFDGTLYGLSNANMGLNAKKPYLEHKTTNYKVPFRISIEDALDSKNMIEWLENQKSEGKPIVSGYLPIDSEGQYTLSHIITDEINAHYMHLEKGIKTIINDYDFVPGITDKIKPFTINNYLRLKDFNEEVINSRAVLETRVDEWLYNGNLRKNYYNEAPKPRSGFSSRQVDLLMLSKTAMLNFFVKCDATSLCGCIDRISLGLIKETILNSKYRAIDKTNIPCAVNLRLSMLKYFKIGGKENMGDMIKPLWEGLKQKVVDNKTNENQICESDIEFYYAAGQLARYLISLSQAQNINYDIIDPILNARDSNKIKKELYGLIKKYSHAISADNKSKRTDALIALVMGYNPERPTEVEYDALIAGFASHNIIYQKEDV